MILWDNLSEAEQNERTATQNLMEEEMISGGVARYWKDYERSPDEGLPEQQLLDATVVHLTPFYQDWIDKICSNHKTPKWLLPLLALGAPKMADLTLRCFMREWLHASMFKEKEFSGFLNVSYPLPTAQKLANIIAQDSFAIIAYQQSKVDFRNDWRKQSKFIKNWTEKRCKAFAKKVGKLSKLPLKYRQDFGHHMIRIAEGSGIFQMINQRYSGGKVWKKKLFVTLRPDILQDLHSKHAALETNNLLFRPMIVPPVDHTLQASGGYLNTWARKEVVQRYNSDYEEGYLKPQSFSQPSQLVLDGLNAKMRTEWSINKPVLEVMENFFLNNTQLANLPAYSLEEFMHNEPYPEEGSKEEQAKWCVAREEYWASWFKSEQHRCRLLVRLNLAKEMAKFSFFYMVYTLDFRGRAYTACELLSCQGSDLDVGLIQFAEARKQTERGRIWMKRHIANLFDQDKFSFDQREQWFDDNVEMLRRISENPYDNREWISNKVKKNPSFQRLAAIFDYFREDGMTQVPVQVDGACNGTQHWSAIMRDEKNAKLTNVDANLSPEDLYQSVADTVTTYCNTNQLDNEFYIKFLNHWKANIPRSVTKRSTMCDAYGLTFYGIQKYLKSEGHLDWVPKDTRNAAITELARAIKVGLDEALEMPNQGKEYLKQLGEITANLNEHITYTVPSGFRVVHAYFKPTKRRSFAELFNKKELIFATHSQTEVDRKAVMQAISPNWIHSLDASHMFCTVWRAIMLGIYQFSMVHDSYGCPAPDMDLLVPLIREEFYEMHQENQLQRLKEDIENELNLRLPELPRRGDFRIERVLESDYLFA